MRLPTQNLGQLAALNRRSIPHEVDYSAQARADFAWYASMTEQELSAVLRSMPARRRRTEKIVKDEILRLWHECPQLTHREIAAQVGCHPRSISKVVRGMAR